MKHDYSIEYGNIISDLKDLQNGNYYEAKGSGPSVKSISENIEKEINDLLKAIANKEPGIKDKLF